MPMAGYLVTAHGFLPVDLAPPGDGRGFLFSIDRAQLPQNLLQQFLNCRHSDLNPRLECVFCLVNEFGCILDLKVEFPLVSNLSDSRERGVEAVSITSQPERLEMPCAMLIRIIDNPGLFL